MVAGEKIGMGISIVVAFTVFLLTLASTVPRISLDVPILGLSFFYIKVASVIS